MTTERERYLLARCLRLEAEIAMLKGIEVAPALPPIERRSLYDDAPPVAAPRLPTGIVLGRRPKQRHTTADEIAQMRRLRSSGIRPAAIARQIGFSESTVRSYTNDVLLEREIG